MGTEFDILDPGHRIYIDNQARVLGYLDNTELDATLDKYEAMKKAGPSGWGREGHSLDAWFGLDDYYHDPDQPRRYLKDEVTASAYDPNADAAFDILAAVGFRGFTSAVRGGVAGAVDGAKRAVFGAPPEEKQVGPKLKSFAELIERARPAAEVKAVVVPTAGRGAKEKYGGEWKDGHQVGWVPRKVQYGGKTGLGEGDYFTAYEWVQGGTWLLPQFGGDYDEKLPDHLTSGNPYSPWHELVSDGFEYRNKWNKVGDLNDNYRKRIYRQLLAQGQQTDAFGQPIQSPFALGDGDYDELSHAKIMMNLWQVRNRDLLKQIFAGVSQIDLGGSKKGKSTWGDPAQQFILTESDGTKRGVSKMLDRVFYPAIQDVIERRGLGAEPQVAQRTESGFMGDVVERVSRVTRNVVNSAAKGSKEFINLMAATTISAVLGNFWWLEPRTHQRRDSSGVPRCLWPDKRGAWNGGS